MKAPLRQTNVMTSEQWRAFIEYRRVMGLDGEYKVIPAPVEVIQCKAFRCDRFDNGEQKDACERQCIVCRYLKKGT